VSQSVQQSIAAFSASRLEAIPGNTNSSESLHGLQGKKETERERLSIWILFPSKVKVKAFLPEQNQEPGLPAVPSTFLAWKEKTSLLNARS
jgi:hypothetical protein